MAGWRAKARRIFLSTILSAASFTSANASRCDVCRRTVVGQARRLPGADVNWKPCGLAGGAPGRERFCHGRHGLPSKGKRIGYLFDADWKLRCIHARSYVGCRNEAGPKPL